MLTEMFLDSIKTQVAEHLEKQFVLCSDAGKLGLDPRSGYHILVGDQHIVVQKIHNSSLRYYGGFEYVDAEHIHEAGEYVFYCATCERVAGALDLFHDRAPYDREDPEDEE